MTVGVVVEHANSARVGLVEGRRIGTEDVDVLIDGTTTDPGAAVGLPLDSKTVPIEGDLAEDTRGVVGLGVDVANLDGEIGTATRQFEPVHVHERPTTVSEGNPLQASLAVAAPDTAVELAGDERVVGTTPADMETPAVLLNPDNVPYTTPVLRPAQDDPVGLIVDRPLALTAASGHDPTVGVQGDTDSDRSVGIRTTGSCVTVAGISVDAGGAASGIYVLNGVGVDVENVTVSNARDAILGEVTMSLLVRSCDLTGTDGGVRISRLGWNPLLSDSEIRDATAGVVLGSGFLSVVHG